MGGRRKRALRPALDCRYVRQHDDAKSKTPKSVCTLYIRQIDSFQSSWAASGDERTAIECECARRAGEHTDATTADALNDLAQQTDAEGQTPGQKRDMSRYAEVDYQLHLTVARASGVPRFVDDREKLHLHAMA